MASTEQERRDRVANGSRRKRDLAAAGATDAEVATSRERYHRALAWAKENLPDEHAPFAASAAMTIKALYGRHPSVDEVRDRLKLQGRDAASLETIR